MMAMAASEGFSAIENGDSPPAARAAEPQTLPAKVAGCPGQWHRIFHVLLTAAAHDAIAECQAIRLHSDIDTPNAPGVS